MRERIAVNQVPARGALDVHGTAKTVSNVFLR
jgi:hypothetical protein